MMIRKQNIKRVRQKKLWYVIYTKSRSEKKLNLDLEEKGVETYLPMKRELRVWSDRKKWVETPLFPSYVFVRVSDKESHTAIDSQYAVCYVRIKGKPVAIREKQIEALKLLVEDEQRNLDVTNETIETGKPVEVLSGPLKGVQGDVVEIRGKHRLVLRFESLGACVLSEIGISDIKLLEPSS